MLYPLCHVDTFGMLLFSLRFVILAVVSAGHRVGASDIARGLDSASVCCEVMNTIGGASADPRIWTLLQ